jgi:hypothetical protein
MRLTMDWKKLGVSLAALMNVIGRGNAADPRPIIVGMMDDLSPDALNHFALTDYMKHGRSDLTVLLTQNP